MTKKWKDTTRGGYKILSIHGPDNIGEWAGVIQINEALHGVTWNKDGTAYACSAATDEDGDDLDLVPAEPGIDYLYAGARRTNIDGIRVGPRQHRQDTLKLGFDAETGVLVSAEVISK